MPATRRSETAPRRSSRAAKIESDKQSEVTAKQQAEEAKRKAEAAAERKAKAAKTKGKATKSKPVARKAAPVKRKAAEEEEEGSDEDEAEDDKPAPKKRGRPAGRKTQAKATDDAQAEAEDPKREVGGKYAVGDLVEDIEFQNQDDKKVSLAELYKDNGLVIFSYPSCTTQACNFRDTKTAFGEHSFTVLGLSRDKPSAQLSWKGKHELGYDLLCDPEADLLKKLGATEGQKRCHWIIAKGGELLEAKIGVKPADDAKNALAFVKGLENPAGDKKEEEEEEEEEEKVAEPAAEGDEEKKDGAEKKKEEEQKDDAPAAAAAAAAASAEGEGAEEEKKE
ncbi:hypothetical protein JCM11641_005732 [Rhodosporidiobolus odoratus]